MTLSLSEFEAKLGEAKLQMRETARMGGASLGGGAGGLGGIVKTGLTAAAVAAVAFGAASVKMAATWDASMEQIHTQAGASQHEVDALKGKVLALGPAVGAGPQQLAEALYHVESVGLRGKAAMDALTGSVKLAKVGHADLEATSNAVAAAFVTQAKDTRTVTSTIGILNAVIGVGNMRMEDMVGALSTGLLPVAKNVGLGLADVGAALAVMTDRGMRADEAATRLKMTLALVTAPTDKARKALKDMGLSAFDLAHDLRKPDGLSVMLNDLHEHLAKLPADARAADISAIFGGGRSSAAIQTLLNGLGAYDTKLADIKKHSGDFGEAWRRTTQQASFQWDQLKAGAQSFMIQVGNYLIPRLLAFADNVKTFVAPAVQGLIGAWRDNKKQLGELGTLLGGAALVSLRLFIISATNLITTLGVMTRAGEQLATAFARVFQGIAHAALDSFGAILHGADRAFGWVPGVGPKLHHAAAAFDTFKTQALRALDSIASGALLAGERVGDALAQGMLDKAGKVYRAAQTLATYATPHPTGAPGPQRRMAAGGILTEPVMGIGLRSGIAYTLAERGPEVVSPLGHGGSMATAGIGGSGGHGGWGGGALVAEIHTHVHLDGREIARDVRAELLQLGHRNSSVLSGVGVRA